MGFLLKDDEIAALAPRTSNLIADSGRVAVRRAVTQRKQLINVQQRRGCDACPLQGRWHAITTPRMPTMLPKHTSDADILIVGEGPGEQEDLLGQVFVGPTGTMLRDNLPKWLLDRTALQNAVRCRTSNDNRNPTPIEVTACSLHLEDDIERLPIKAILGVGGIPLAHFIGGGTTILRIHGTRFPVRIGSKTLWYYPIFHPSFVSRMAGKYDEGPAFPAWTADIRRFARQVDTWGQPKIYDLDPNKVIVPANREEAENLVRRMRGPKAVDLETNDLRPYNKGAKILTAAVSDGEITIAFSVLHDSAPSSWGMDFLYWVVETYHWVAHQAGFELAWLVWTSAQLGREKELQIFEDTMALARLYHERETLLDLGIVTRIHLGVNVKQISNLKTARITEYPLPETLRYNGLDAMATAMVYHKLRRHVNTEHYERLLARTESFTMMQLYGLDIDRKAAQGLIDQWEGLQDAASLRAHQLFEVKQYEKTYGSFSISAPAQVGKALVEFGKIQLPKTAGGKQYATTDDILSAADPKHKHPLITAVLDWREAGKLKGTYGEAMLTLSEKAVDGRIHPCYSTYLVATFRSSSEDPNAQNWPSRKHREIRRPVVAPPGHSVVAFDFGQLQVRILAMAAKDYRLIKDLVTGRDTHSYWLNNLVAAEPAYLERLAHETNETDEAAIRKAGRNIIKSDFVFASFFGSGIDSIAERTNISKRLVRELQAAFWEEYAIVHEWLKEQRRMYKETGMIRGLSGLVRRSIFWANEMIITPIQMGEADIVLAAQSALSKAAIRTGDLNLHPRINIHDDLTFMIRDQSTEELAEYIEKIAAEMVKVRFPWQICPLNVEVKIGPNWADMKTIHSHTGDYIK